VSLDGRSFKVAAGFFRFHSSILTRENGLLLNVEETFIQTRSLREIAKANKA
jgi:hypothetical protein